MERAWSCPACIGFPYPSLAKLRITARDSNAWRYMPFRVAVPYFLLIYPVFCCPFQFCTRKGSEGRGKEGLIRCLSDLLFALTAACHRRILKLYRPPQRLLSAQSFTRAQTQTHILYRNESPQSWVLLTYPPLCGIEKGRCFSRRHIRTN